MTLPKGGAVLDHSETFAIEAAGQAIDWDEADPGMLYGIDRAGGRILAMRIGVGPHRPATR
jgi:hypothetical protein